MKNNDNENHKPFPHLGFNNQLVDWPFLNLSPALYPRFHPVGMARYDDEAKDPSSHAELKISAWVMRNTPYRV